MRRSLWHRVGGFNEELLSGSDREFCNRAGRIGYAPRARVDHPPRQSLEELVEKARRVARGEHQRRSGELDLSLLTGPLPPLRTASRLLRDHSFGTAAVRTQAFAVAWAVKWAGFAERMRLLRRE